LGQAVRQDEIFWRTAFEEHGPAVLAFLRSRLGDFAAAEDLLQETFVRSIRAGSFRDGGNLRGYLLSTARNLIINRLRRPRLVVAVETPESGADPLDGLDPDAVSPERRASWRAFTRRLDEALESLSESHRRAFDLALVEQRSYEEIGQLTGWSPSLVKINIYRARQQIVAQLGECLPEAGWSLS